MNIQFSVISCYNLYTRQAQMAFDYKIHFLVQIDVGYFLFILPFYFLLNRPPARPSYVDIYNITHAESLDQSVN